MTITNNIPWITPSFPFVPSSWNISLPSLYEEIKEGIPSSEYNEISFSLDLSDGGEKIYTLTRDQARFISQKDTSCLWTCGRGAGATYANCLKAIQYLLDYPGCSGLFLSKSHVLQEWIVRCFFQIFPEEELAKYSKSSSFITCKNGSHLSFKNAQFPDYIRGGEYAFLAVDEISEENNPSLLIARQTLRQKGYPLQEWRTYTERDDD